MIRHFMYLKIVSQIMLSFMYLLQAVHLSLQNTNYNSLTKSTQIGTKYKLNNNLIMYICKIVPMFKRAVLYETILLFFYISTEPEKKEKQNI